MWFDYSQNNSGGSWQSGMAQHILIEADNLDEANRLAENIGIYFDGVHRGCDCECCGDRWHEPWSEGSEEPQVYGESVLTAVPSFSWPTEYVLMLPLYSKTLITPQEWAKSKATV